MDIGFDGIIRRWYDAAMKVLIAMSGGVDSSAAAGIMKERGAQCIGATMQLYAPLKDIEAAKAVAAKLCIPHYVFDFGADFETHVIRPFIEAYKNGRTPNPCVCCNRHLKFRALLDKAEELGCDHIVTGHYAGVEKRLQEDGTYRYVLRKSSNTAKDQSYVLSMLTQEQLSKCIFPLEGLSKDETRRFAENAGLETADKPESQDICFVPNGRYAEFIEAHESMTFPEGNFRDEQGNVMGRHKGIIRYTVGQRKGLGIAAGRPVYVKEIDPQTNEVILCDNERLFTDTIVSYDFNWVSITRPAEAFYAKARIRYQHEEQPAWIFPEKDGSLRIRFDEPQRAITPGQTVVVYDGDLVIGGGTIDLKK